MLNGCEDRASGPATSLNGASWPAERLLHHNRSGRTPEPDRVRPAIPQLDLGLLRDFQCIINIDPKVSNMWSCTYGLFRFVGCYVQ